MKKLKIGMVTPWGRVRCGIRSYSENLINSLVKYGVEVYVIRWPRFGILTKEIIQNIVEKIPVDKIDILHVQAEYGLFKNLDGYFYNLLKDLNIPIVTTAHAVGSFEVDPIIASVSDRVIVHNRFCFKRFGFPEKTIIIEHGCQPTETPSMDECKRRFGIDPRIPIVGYLGFISKYKGLEILISAISRIPNVALLIGGGYHVEPGTSYIDNLKRWSLQVLPGRVQWLGYVPDEEMKYVYGAMDLFVYPSIYSSESGALLTAVSHGKACIARDLPPFKEKERRKALVTFKDLDDLVEKIKYFVSDVDARRKLEDGARKYAFRYRWDVVARKHIKLYWSLI